MPISTMEADLKGGFMDYYRLLGVRYGAQPMEIKLAYEALKEISADDPGLQLELHTAYQTLMNPYSRDLYEQMQMDMGEPEAPAEVVHAVAPLALPERYTNTVVIREAAPAAVAQDSGAVAVQFILGFVVTLFIIGMVIFTR